MLCYRLTKMGDSEDIQIDFSQYAQDPYQLPIEFDDSDLYKKVRNTICNPKPKKRDNNKTTKVNNKIIKRNLARPPCFVINNEAAQGSKLIKIQIIDIRDGVPNQNGEGEENVLLSAQYVASDGYDEIIECTEGVVNKISKKLTGYSLSL